MNDRKRQPQPLNLDRAFGRFLRLYHDKHHLEYARRLRDSCAHVLAAYPALEATEIDKGSESRTRAVDAFDAALLEVVDGIQQLEKLATIGELAVLLGGSDEIDSPRKRLDS